jgi:integrase
MKAKGFKDWTQHTILTDLKKMFAFAKKKKYISDNPFEDIRNPQPETLKLHTSIEDEFAFFRALYHINKKYFLMMLTERLAGFRFSDNQAMTRDMIDLKKKLFVKVRNVKGKREEMFPISDALALAFEKVWEPYEKFAFPQVTIQAVNKAIKDACKEAGIKQLASHQFKSNYAHEIEEQETYRHIFKMLMHHKDQDVSARYTGKNIELMRKVLNRSQERWMKLVVGL